MGTRFEVRLRFRHASGETGDSPGPTQNTDTTSHFDAPILLVEDNPVNQEVAHSMLEALGCRVDTAFEGGEALRAMQDKKYRLVLMDCHMPGMDGFGATQEIRRLELEQGRSPIPIIALTADVQAGIVERCHAAGMNDYLCKPFSLAQLKTVVEKWLSSTPRHRTAT